MLQMLGTAVQAQEGLRYDFRVEAGTLGEALRRLLASDGRAVHLPS